MSVSPTELDELRALAVTVAERAAAIHRDGRERGFAIENKTSASDLVTEVDRAAERAIVDAIVAARPDDAILGEEGTDRDGTSGVRWVVDPLDGTASYVRGYPGYCSSIGVEIDGEPTIGVTVDSRGVRTEGVVGVGAFRGERRIEPSTRVDLAECVVSTGFGYRRSDREQQARVASIVLPEVADIRRSGSAAFDLVATACGEVDAYYEVGLYPWDLAAGMAIVTAAGGVCRSMDQPAGGRLVVSAPAQLFEPLLALLARAGLTTT